MRSEGYFCPEKDFSVEKNGDSSRVTFYENITECADDRGIPLWRWEEFSLTVGVLSGLDEKIEGARQEWLAAAKAEEIKRFAAEIRKKRDALLAKSDYSQLPDSPLGADKREEYRLYRQALRELPESEGFPFLDFPAPPK